MLNNYREKKVCLKCGEVYKKLNFLWQINRNSGIPYVKKEYKILICENGVMFFSPPGQIKLNTRLILIVLVIMIKERWKK